MYKEFRKLKYNYKTVLETWKWSKQMLLKKEKSKRNKNNQNSVQYHLHKNITQFNSIRGFRLKPQWTTVRTAITKRTHNRQHYDECGGSVEKSISKLKIVINGGWEYRGMRVEKAYIIGMNTQSGKSNMFECSTAQQGDYYFQCHRILDKAL